MGEVRWFRTFDWSNRCKLQLDLDWYTDTECGIALRYGLRGCDDVWCLAAEITNPPRWLERIIDRRQAARRG